MPRLFWPQARRTGDFYFELHAAALPSLGLLLMRFMDASAFDRVALHALPISIAIQALHYQRRLTATSPLHCARYAREPPQLSQHLLPQNWRRSRRVPFFLG